MICWLLLSLLIWCVEFPCLSTRWAYARLISAHTETFRNLLPVGKCVDVSEDCGVREADVP